MSEQSATAAWRPDPSGRFDHRYWDGAAWTEHVAKAGTQSLDPLAPGAPAEDTGAREHVGRHAKDAATGAPAKVGMMQRVRDARESALLRKKELEAQAQAKKEQLQARVPNTHSLRQRTEDAVAQSRSVRTGADGGGNR